VVAAIVALALLSDFTNGFHDAANSIATVVSTRVLTPWVAVIWAAVFNFVAFMVFKTTWPTPSAGRSTRTWSARRMVATVVVAALIAVGALADRRRSRHPHVQAGPSTPTGDRYLAGQGQVRQSQDEGGHR
jgi:phosphate/sulfate permease